MTSMETALLRGKRRAEGWLKSPKIRQLVWIAAYALGGLLLAAGAVLRMMQPIAVGLICAAPGLYVIPAAVGSALGYWLFWPGADGIQGIGWALTALGLQYGLTKWYSGEGRAGRLAAGTAFLVAAWGLVSQLLFRDRTSLMGYFVRIALGSGSVFLFLRLRDNRTATARYLAGAVAVLALAGVPGYINFGCVAAGVLAGAESLPAAALAGLSLELAGATELPVTGVLCLACFFRLLPIPGTYRRMGACGMSCIAVMALSGVWDWGTWLGLSMGGMIGAAIPWNLDPLSRHTGTGAAQVQLEHMAGTLDTLQRMLLDISPPPVDDEALAARVRDDACRACSAREHCTAEITAGTIRDPMGFQCRKSGRALAALRHQEERRKLLLSARKCQGEYRSALIQQYGFLAESLRGAADRLARGQPEGQVRFRLQVSARSRGRSGHNGDLCTAFPGTGKRYYVLLCDGMGTGTGAAEEAAKVSRLLRQMLSAGMPPQYALGTVNAHLTLENSAGAVTLDLAEVRLDTGKASVYKWGAAPSYLVRRGTLQPMGSPEPPPGLSLTDTREWSAGLSLGRGETLLLVSDGVEIGEDPPWVSAAETTSPGALAEKILEWGGKGEDDATAAVIRLCPVTAAS